MNRDFMRRGPATRAPLDDMVEEVHRVLAAQGFRRRGTRWRREGEANTDIVDVQLGRFGDEATVNLGVLDHEAYGMTWGKSPPRWPDAARCTASTRLGFLSAGLDTWWPVPDNAAAAEAAALLEDVGLPWLDSLHDDHVMEQYLQKPYSWTPAQDIALAIVRRRCGRFDDACETLRAASTRLIPAARATWGAIILSVLELLACPQRESRLSTDDVSRSASDGQHS